MSQEKSAPPPPPPPPGGAPVRPQVIRLARRNPKRFDKDAAQAESVSDGYRVDFVTTGAMEERVVVYRYGNRHVTESFRSYRRLGTLGPPGPDVDLNAILHDHTHRIIPESPFVSVILDWRKLYEISEPQARESIEGAADVIVFHVPADRLYRPDIISAATRTETEWCVIDYPEPFSFFIASAFPNPFASFRMFLLHLSVDANSAAPAVRASLNRNPQPIRVDYGGGYPEPVIHWAWQRGNVLRVESPVDLVAKIGPAKAITAHFVNPDFDLSVIRVTHA